ncbi:benomyl/methotrexate resistance protein [Eremomyces bilateralis CBS 781.70]|uniref:Benomyl/methotrexate resistance protein n=1 Tax=Eremomyces bilateralis CBS 781.70 TaxID=1392243 RepID=A0A6G1GDA4_9PEZI|nr:benomyl/methotrexate resistance protein [Eremomyces bilateralis CBS 781.70]KAF1816004.1 benomyl/methotrexate resistance protein [Eremomyces bilateralis CBS 781.70]
MSDLIRDAPIGQIIRYLTKNKVLQYPEERADFELPESYADANTKFTPKSPIEPVSSLYNEKPLQPEASPASEEVEPPIDLDLEKLDTALIHDGEHSAHLSRIQSSLTRVTTRGAFSRSHTRAELEHQITIATMERGPTRQIVPERTSDGAILVDWYTTDDPDNPQNWSLKKKLFVAGLIYLYTFSVYMGSSIFTASYTGVIEEFGVSLQKVTLGLSMYVLAYGVGPMLFSPISEMPSVGRNPPYIVTFLIFVLMLIPAALARNFSGLIAARFFQGFFGSPCLATAGASLQDIFSMLKLPYAISLWALVATCGPAFGPIIAGFSTPVEGWRWSQWELLWLAAPVWLAMFLFLPETSTPNILLRRANRLRALTGENRLKSQGEVDQSNMTVNGLIIESLWRPMQLMLLDPSIAFTAVYIALIYGIFYSFFESFPLVYMEIYGFNQGQTGLTFISITVGTVVALSAYWAYIYWIVEPEIRTSGLGAPERRLIPALFSAFLVPAGLFIFAWTASPSIHWIVSIIGVGIFCVGVTFIIQCIFMYLPLSYPQYAASLFAGNDFARSALASGTIHFSTPMYHSLGVDRGVSLLAGLTVGCIAGVYILYFYGATLRANSRFAAK